MTITSGRIEIALFLKDQGTLIYSYTLKWSEAIIHRIRGHGGRVVTLSPPTSEAGVRFRVRPQVGKLVVACRWSAIYSTEP